MKLGEARKTAFEHLNLLSQRKSTLKKMLQDEPPPAASGASFDRVEISKALSAVEKEYSLTQDLAEKLSQMDANIQNTEISRQQCEAAAEAMEELMKILEVFRRIAKGDQVPATDERKLMEYSQEMYMAAKNMALMNQNCEGEKHKSLWEETPSEEEQTDPAELAANTEVGNPFMGAPVSQNPSEAAPSDR